MIPRVTLWRLRRAEEVFALTPKPSALLVDIEGTLTGFTPDAHEVAERVSNFDVLASCHGVALEYVHYVTNAALSGGSAPFALRGRFHGAARKPFFAPPAALLELGGATVVVGDQYLTDGLLAWRYQLSFGLVEMAGKAPLWPILQRRLGRPLEAIVFRATDSR